MNLWRRGWVLALIGGLLLAACAAPAPLPDAPAPPVVAMPLIVAADPAVSGTATAVPPQPKPTSSSLLAQVREALLPTATQTPAPTAVPSATPEPSPTPCASPGMIIQNTFETSLAGPLPYRVYLPPCYEEAELTYPVLYMLPGNVHTDAIWDELGLDEAAERLIRAGEAAPFMIVMVSGGYLADNTSGGPGSYEAMFMDEFVPHVEQTYCAWPSRKGRALGGMSRGGYWALEIAFRHPEKFGSVGGHSAALLDAYGGTDVNPEDTGLANDLGGMRVYFDIGENDWVINNLRLLHERMTEAGIAHEWVLNEGSHEEAYWAAHVDDYVAYYSAPWRVEDFPRCRPLP